jgi:50S ribosomal subunit-associated GTPase HflX
VVDQTLGDLSLNGRRVVHVFNKMDRVSNGHELRARAVNQYEDAVFVSALEPPAVDELKAKFVELVNRRRVNPRVAG